MRQLNGEILLPYGKRIRILTRFVDAKPRFALRLIDNLIDKDVFEIIGSTCLLLAGLTILAPIASGSECDYGLANVAFDASPPESAIVAMGQQEKSASLESPAADGSDTGHSKIQPIVEQPASKPTDVNRDIYYKNKLEFSLEAGWLPINIPLPFDVFSGDAYNT